MNEVAILQAWMWASLRKTSNVGGTSHVLLFVGNLMLVLQCCDVFVIRA